MLGANENDVVQLPLASRHQQEPSPFLGPLPDYVNVPRDFCHYDVVH